MAWCPKCKTKYTNKNQKMCKKCNVKLVNKYPDSFTRKKNNDFEEDLLKPDEEDDLILSSIENKVNNIDTDKNENDDINKNVDSGDSKELSKIKDLDKDEISSKAKDLNDEKVIRNKANNNNKELKKKSTSNARTDIEKSKSNNIQKNNNYKDTNKNNNNISNKNNNPNIKSKNDSNNKVFISKKNLFVNIKDYIKKSLFNNTINDSDDNYSNNSDTDDVLDAKNPKLKDFIPDGHITYKYRKDLYADNYSSAIILMAFGIIGIIMMVLNFLGMISLFTSAFQYILGTAIFIIFIFWGSYSFKLAQKYKKGIRSEEKILKHLKNVLSDKITEDYLDSINDNELSYEENYLLKLDAVKQMILEENPDWDEDFIDKVVEDFFNDNNF